MMEEEWKPIEDFPGYHVSNFGRVWSDRSDRNLVYSENQFGVIYVGMVRDGVQHRLSVALLTANAFVERKHSAWTTPINLDGDRYNNRVDNLAWRPRWFAVKYNRQFVNHSVLSIDRPVEDLKTGEVSPNTFECAKRYGILESEIIESIYNNTYVWPTYQQFRLLEI